jgi:hypothetical protein
MPRAVILLLKDSIILSNTVIPVKDPTHKQRNLFDRLAILNLTKKTNIYTNITDREIENTIEEQIQTYQNNSS